MTTRSIFSRRPGGALLTAVIVELTAATAYIHFTLGGTLFLLNGLGYVALAMAYVVVAALPIPAVQRFGWSPRLGLAGYTMATIGAYLVIGPYFVLGWVAKGIEVAIVGLVAVDLLGEHGSVRGLVRSATASVAIGRRQGGLQGG